MRLGRGGAPVAYSDAGKGLSHSRIKAPAVSNTTPSPVRSVTRSRFAGNGATATGLARRGSAIVRTTWRAPSKATRRPRLGSGGQGGRGQGGAGGGRPGR